MLPRQQQIGLPCAKVSAQQWSYGAPSCDLIVSRSASKVGSSTSLIVRTRRTRRLAETKPLTVSDVVRFLWNHRLDAAISKQLPVRF